MRRRRGVIQGGDALVCDHALQELVLEGEQIGRRGQGLARVHQRTEGGEEVACGRLCVELHAHTALVAEHRNQPKEQLSLAVAIHLAPPSARRAIPR